MQRFVNPAAYIVEVEVLGYMGTDVSEVNIWFNHQKIATKGFSTDSGSFQCTLLHSKSLGRSNPWKCIFSRWRPIWPYVQSDITEVNKREMT